MEAGRDLSDVLRDLYGATNSALGEGADDKQLNGLVTDNRDANQTIVDVKKKKEKKKEKKKISSH